MRALVTVDRVPSAVRPRRPSANRRSATVQTPTPSSAPSSGGRRVGDQPASGSSGLRREAFVEAGVPVATQYEATPMYQRPE